METNDRIVEPQDNEIRRRVRNRYANVALSPAGGCSSSPSCCATQAAPAPGASGKLGYGPDELGSVPEGANMGLGCGNPQEIALLKEGEVLLDLGCGGGFDCFLAAEKVGSSGRVIGVDMTPEMIDKAGFRDFSVEVQERSRDFIRDWFPGTGCENDVRAAAITGRK